MDPQLDNAIQILKENNLHFNVINDRRKPVILGGSDFVLRRSDDERSTKFYKNSFLLWKEEHFWVGSVDLGQLILDVYRDIRLDVAAQAIANYYALERAADIGQAVRIALFQMQRKLSLQTRIKSPSRIRITHPAHEEQPAREYLLDFDATTRNWTLRDESEAVVVSGTIEEMVEQLRQS